MLPILSNCTWSGVWESGLSCQTASLLGCILILTMICIASWSDIRGTTTKPVKFFSRLTILFYGLERRAILFKISLAVGLLLDSFPLWQGNDGFLGSALLFGGGNAAP